MSQTKTPAQPLSAPLNMLFNVKHLNVPIVRSFSTSNSHKQFEF